MNIINIGVIDIWLSQQWSIIHSQQSMYLFTTFADFWIIFL